MNDRLSRNSLTLVGKVNREEVVFLAVPVFVLDETLRNVFERLRILSDPYENSWHPQDENVNNLKTVGRYKSTVNWKELTAGGALYSKPQTTLRLCSNFNGKLFVATRKSTDTALFRYRNRAEITVLMSEKKPYPLWFLSLRNSNPVWCEHCLNLWLSPSASQRRNPCSRSR